MDNADISVSAAIDWSELVMLFNKGGAMKYKVDGWNNFCRVFELPESYPKGFCFNGGHSVNFKLVDWFNPVCGIPQPTVSREVWMDKVGKIETKEIDLADLEETLVPWLQSKIYVKPCFKYLVLYDFGGATVFNA